MTEGNAAAKGAGERLLDRLLARYEADPDRGAEHAYPRAAGAMSAVINIIAEQIERAREERTARDMRRRLAEILADIEAEC